MNKEQYNEFEQYNRVSFKKIITTKNLLLDHNTCESTSKKTTRTHACTHACMHALVIILNCAPNQS